MTRAASDPQAPRPSRGVAARSRAGRLAEVRDLEPRLWRRSSATARSTKPALRLRLGWRLASGDRDRAREAITLLDTFMADYGTPPDALLRARLAAGGRGGADRLRQPARDRGPGPVRVRPSADRARGADAARAGPGGERTRGSGRPARAADQGVRGPAASLTAGSSGERGVARRHAAPAPARRSPRRRSAHRLLDDALALLPAGERGVAEHAGGRVVPALARGRASAGPGRAAAVRHRLLHAHRRRAPCTGSSRSRSRPRACRTSARAPRPRRPCPTCSDVGEAHEDALRAPAARAAAFSGPRGGDAGVEHVEAPRAVARDRPRTICDHRVALRVERDATSSPGYSRNAGIEAVGQRRQQRHRTRLQHAPAQVVGQDLVVAQRAGADRAPWPPRPAAARRRGPASGPSPPPSTACRPGARPGAVPRPPRAGRKRLGNFATTV